MAVLVILQLLLQMYEADFQDWGQSPSDSVDKTVNPLQSEVAIIEADNNREMEQLMYVKNMIVHCIATIYFVRFAKKPLRLV